MLRKIIKNLIWQAIKKEFPGFNLELENIAVEWSGNVYGDLASNVALQVAKELKKSPMEIARILSAQITSQKESLTYFREVAAAPPGFLNFYLSDDFLQKQIPVILKEGKNYGDLKMGRNKKVQVEFISANPTGPLTIGNARGGPFGDVLANVLEKAGFNVWREYYINDVGEQIKKLGHSVIGDKEAVYKGEYIEQVRKKLNLKSDVLVMEVGQKAAEIILRDYIKKPVEELGIRFDCWFSEKTLYDANKVDKVLDFLKNKDLIYPKDGAWWFCSSKYGDEKDRVVIKKDGQKTYLASDLAYHQDKFRRGFDKVINVWGADHYGDIARLKAGVEALGYKGKLEIILLQFVRMMAGDKQIKMSKRAGTYVTLEDLIDEAGKDAVRFFFLARSPDTHLSFDINLAKEQSKKNPVYYVQYANARICAILRKCGKSKFPISNFQSNPKSQIQNSKPNLLKHISELSLIKQLIKFPEIIEDTAKDYQLQRLPQYAIEIADAFHKFYENCPVISKDKGLTIARLSLIKAAQVVLKNTLDLLGVSAPEKM